MVTDIIKESIDHIPVISEEIRNILVNSIGKRGHEVEDISEDKTASFSGFHVFDGDTSDSTRPTKRIRCVSRDKPNNTKPKVQSESLLRRASLTLAMRIALGYLHESPQLRLPNPFHEDCNLATGHRPKTKTYGRRNSQASYTDNSDKGELGDQG